MYIECFSQVCVTDLVFFFHLPLFGRTYSFHFCRVRRFGSPVAWGRGQAFAERTARSWDYYEQIDAAESILDGERAR